MDLNEILEKLNALPEAERKEIEQEALKATNDLRWIPSPGPQTEAYFSKADILLYGGEPGGGKLLDLKTQIVTPNGYTTIGDISVGDQVFDESGKICNVIAKSAIEKEPTYRLTFSDGSEVIAGMRHQWVTSTRRERQYALKTTDEYRAKRRETRKKRGTGKRPDLAARNSKYGVPRGLPLKAVRTTQEIYDTLTVGTDNRVNHAIEVAGPLQLPEAELLIPPYVLGAWLGDGTSTAGAITGLDKEIFQEIAKHYKVTEYKDEKTKGILGLQPHLKAVGVFGNKHIPQQYLRASIEQRLALLQGLMDTDGHANQRGQCEICLTRKPLIDGVLELIHTLGIKATIVTSRAKLNSEDKGPKYTIKFMTELVVFRLQRKIDLQKRTGFRGTHKLRYIVRCDPVPEEPLQCIQVDSPSHMYLVGRECIPTHNSSLLLGLAHTQHKRSLIMRQQYTDLGHLIEEAIRFNGTRKGFNGSPPPKLHTVEDRLIEFFAAAAPGDEQHRQGNPFDLLGIDEATQLARSQILFLKGWLRSTEAGQRKRIVLATNPPLSAEGLWIVEMFAPWLDPKFPHPAVPGELRYAIMEKDNELRWVEGPDPVWSDDKQKMVEPESYTFIPASVQDNPYLADTDYEKSLDNMDTETHKVMMGGFQTTFRDAPNQIIPTEWVRAAQRRWTPEHPVGVPMCAMGVDCTGGGKDPLVIAPRYDTWFAPLIDVPGSDLPIESLGRTAASIIVANRRDQAIVIVDMGGGYGGSTYEVLSENEIDVAPYKGGTKSDAKTKDRQLKFANTRTKTYWRFREALDPDQEGGSRIALPSDQKLLADLTAVTFKIKGGVIHAETKEDVVKKLGRSTDHGDAVVMCWSDGPKFMTDGGEWMEKRDKILHRKKPRVLMGRKFHSRRKR